MSKENCVVLDGCLAKQEICAGQLFLHTDDEAENEVYMLCRFRVETYSLICLQDGERWEDPTSLEEIRTILMNDCFVSIGNAKITISEKD
jgi:hypothetical protein